MTEDLTLTQAEWVQTFQAHFQGSLRQISTLSVLVHQKILIVTLLESLAKARHPKTRGDRKRFLRLLDSSSTWEDRDRVSLPQLLYRLEEQPEIAPVLAASVSRRLTRWRWGTVYPMAGRDPLISELRGLCRGPSGERVSRLAEEAKHGNLLYTYRSYLVHESRPPGDGMELGDHDRPYYHSLVADGDRRWELVYPVSFFYWLVNSTLGRVCEYFLDEDKDPYESYDFGAVWRARPM